MKPAIFLLITLYVTGPCASDQLSANNQPVHEYIDGLSSDDNHCEFIFHPGNIREVSMNSGDDVHVGYLTCPDFDDPVPGRPVVPRYTMLVAVPPEGSVTLTVPGSQKTLNHIPGLLSWTANSTGQNGDYFTFSNSPSVAVLPGEPASISRFAWFRGNRLAVIDLFPILFDSNQKIVTRFDSLHIRLDYSGIPSSLIDAPKPDHVTMTTLAEQLVINPGSVHRFRSQGCRPSSMPTTNRSVDSGWRVTVSRDGICRITDAIDFTGVDPRTISVYCLGQEIPIYIHGEEDAEYNDGDYIEFPCSKYRNPDDTDNKFTDTGVYWVVAGGITGLRIPIRDGSQPGGSPADAFTETLLEEHNSIFSYGDYYWQSLRAQQTVQVIIQVDQHTLLMDPCLLTIRLKGVTSLQDINPDHHIRVSWNGTQVADQYWDGTDELLINVPIPSASVNAGDNVMHFLLPGDTGAGEIDGAFLDWIEFEHAVPYVTGTDSLRFGEPVSSPGGLVQYDLSGFVDPSATIYRLNPLQRITGVSVFPHNARFIYQFTDTTDSDTLYDACSSSGYILPDSVTFWPGSNLASNSNRADYLIISHPDFIPELTPLQTYIESKGLDVLIVSIDDIFNEFSHGIWNPDAVHEFCRTAFFNYSGNPPSNVLLVGDSSWDYKMFLTDSRPVNYLPAYGKIWTESSIDPYDRGPYDSTDLLYGEPMVDDQFVCVSGDDNLPDMAIGRLPVQTTDQLRNVIERTIAYSGQSRDQSWQKNILFINGGVGDPEQDMFFSQSETIISNLVQGSGRYWRVSRIYKETDHREWGWYEDDIIEKINSGELLINFLGHAGTWSWEAMLNFTDLDRINHGSKCPIITSMTCNTARFANPFIDSFGEQFVLGLPSAGSAAAFWGGCNFGGYWSDYYMAYYFYSNAVKNRIARIGTAILLTKITTLTRYPGYSIIIEPYSLIGEPSLDINLASAPIILLCGYMDSHLSSSAGGSITLAAFVIHPDGPAHIDHVELLFNGQSTGIFLLDDGAHGDLGEGDGMYAVHFEIPPNVIGPMSLLLEIEAIDINSYRSQARPVLGINE